MVVVLSFRSSRSFQNFLQLELSKASAATTQICSNTATTQGNMHSPMNITLEKDDDASVVTVRITNAQEGPDESEVREQMRGMRCSQIFRF